MAAPGSCPSPLKKCRKDDPEEVQIERSSKGNVAETEGGAESSVPPTETGSPVTTTVSEKPSAGSVSAGPPCAFERRRYERGDTDLWESINSSLIDKESVLRTLRLEDASFNRDSFAQRVSTITRRRALINILIQGLYASDLDAVFSYARSLRILALENPARWDTTEVTRRLDRPMRAIPRLLTLVHLVDRPDIQFEASWLVSEMSRWKSTLGRLVNEGACPLYIRLLDSGHQFLISDSVFVLANVTDADVRYTELVIKQGILPSLASAIIRSARLGEPWTFIPDLARCLHNLALNCREVPLLPMQVFLPVIRQLLVSSERFVAQHACRTIAVLAREMDKEYAQHVVDMGFLKDLVNVVCGSKDNSIVLPALTAIVRLARLHPQSTIDHGALTAFKESLSGNDSYQYYYTVTTGLSYMVTGRQLMLEAVMDADMLPFLVKFLQSKDEYVQSNTATTLSTMIQGVTNQEIVLLLLEGTFPALVDILTNQPNSSSRLIANVLLTLLEIVFAGKKTNQCQAVWDSCERTQLVAQVKILQRHRDKLIAARAVRLTEVCCSLL